MAQENLTDVINKRFGNSLTHFLKLVDPARRYPADLNLSKAWSELTLTEQRKLYLYILYRKWRGLDIFGEPYAIVKNCHPVPFNWNGCSLMDTFAKSGTKFVCAAHKGEYGLYTRDEALLYEMTNPRPIN